MANVPHEERNSAHFALREFRMREHGGNEEKPCVFIVGKKRPVVVSTVRPFFLI